MNIKFSILKIEGPKNFTKTIFKICRAFPFKQKKRIKILSGAKNLLENI